MPVQPKQIGRESLAAAVEYAAIWRWAAHNRGDHLKRAVFKLHRARFEHTAIPVDIHACPVFSDVWMGMRLPHRRRAAHADAVHRNSVRRQSRFDLLNKHIRVPIGGVRHQAAKL